MVVGLLTLIVIVGGNKLLGALSALIGFAIATVGIDIGTGQQRYTFGSVELINGIDFIPVAIGLFGVGEILHTLWRGGHLEKLAYFNVSSRAKGFWPNKQDYRESAGPIARGSFLGFFVGATPGAGATVASLMSYNLEKSVSKTPEKFGKGAMAGLAGPEAANNAASSGAMVPLLTLGIPGSASTAVLMGGFLMWGLQPGPLLMTQNPEFAWGLIASMYLGNVMLLAVNIFAIPAFASIARVPFRVLGPMIIVICVLGTFTVNGEHRRGHGHARLRGARLLHASLRPLPRRPGHRPGARPDGRGVPAADDDHLRAAASTSSSSAAPRRPCWSSWS